MSFQVISSGLFLSVKEGLTVEERSLCVVCRSFGWFRVFFSFFKYVLIGGFLLLRGEEVLSMAVKSTKMKALVIVLLFVALTVGSVYAVSTLRSPPARPSNGFSSPEYIWNSNGMFWSASAENLQASLDLGGITYVPAVTIVTDASIVMPSNSGLIGYGQQSILKAGSQLHNNPIVKNANVRDANLVIRDLAIDGSDTAHAYVSYGVQWVNVSNGTIDGVFVKDTGRDGIRGVSCDHTRFTNIVTNNTGHHAVMFSYGSKYCEMSGLLITGSHTESAIVEHPNPFTGEVNHDILISDVVTRDCGQFGIFIGDCYAVGLTNCISERSSGEGLIVTDCSDVTVSGFQSLNNMLGAGIKVNTSAHGVVLSGCIIRYPGQGGSFGYQLLGTDIVLSNSQSWYSAGPVYFNNTFSKNITVDHCSFKDYSNYVILRGADVSLESCRFGTPTASLPFVVNIDTGAVRARVVGCDFTSCPVTSRRVNDASGNAIIRDNAGFETDYYMRNAGTVALGLNNVYGAALTIAPASHHIIGPPVVQLRELGSLSGNETITIKIEAVYASGYTVNITRTHTANNYSYFLSQADWVSLAHLGQYYNETLVKLNFYAKTSAGTSSGSEKLYFVQMG
jgi:hypothetical protein